MKTPNNFKKPILKFEQLVFLKYGMDKNKFNQWVRAVAVVQDIKPKVDGGNPNYEVLEVRQNDEWLELERKTNPTLGFKFVKIKDQARPCELASHGCKDFPINQIIEKRFVTTPEPHWRTRCANCGHYKHPGEQLLIASSGEMISVSNRYFNKVNK